MNDNYSAPAPNEGRVMERVADFRPPRSQCGALGKNPWVDLRGWRLTTSCFWILFAWLLCAKSWEVRAATLPAGFSETTISGPVSGAWNLPVGIHFEDNGRIYVWEKSGRVWFKEYGASTWTLLINLGEEVGDWRDFGMLGFALDPNFRVNGYIYLLYVVDRHHLMNFGTQNYNSSSNQYLSATIGRITRYTARAADGLTSVDYATRRVLLGETKTNGFPILYESHGVGSLVFGTDGTLLASCGDGASYSATDVGSDPATYYSQALTDGIIRPKENVGAYRSQLADSLSGKIVRIDPATGDGIPGNPFYDAANPRAAKSRVWALGLRNPCRMTLRPETGSHNRADANPGVIYIGDVGYQTWEDLNVCTGPGQNFGWPAFEGIDVHSGYYNANAQNLDAPNPLYPGSGCSQYFYFRDLVKQNTSVAANKPPFNNPCNAAQKITNAVPQFLQTPPALDWKHGTTQARTWIYNGSGVATAINVGAAGSPVFGSMFPGNCSIGGVWYTGNDFPATNKNTYFHADYGEGWIKRFVFDTNNKPVSVTGFLTGGGGIVAVATHPLDGGLYYVDVNASELRKVGFSGNLPPTASASANTNYGPGPLAVQFTDSGSTDPEGLPLTYNWNFGDGTANSSATNPSHTFNAPPNVPTPYTVTLTVTDSAGQTSVTTLLITVNNTPPTVTITNPVDGSKYSMASNTVYNLTATVFDTESADSQLKYEWKTFFHHNNHEHQSPVDTNHVTTAVISPAGCDGINIYYYRIQLTVTDPAGLSTTRDVKIFPDCGTPDTPPVISNIPNQTIAQDQSTGPIVFTVSDAETASANLQLSASSSNPTLVPQGNVIFGDNGINRTVTVTPTAGQTGTATITVTVNDGPNNTSTNFVLTVQSGPLGITVGNTNNGTLIDDIGAAWINAGRFQATANLTAVTMYAKVGAITGKYKCAIYSDSGGLPSRLLRSSAEVSNPATGWRSFALTSSLALTNGQFYWLAIWSDNANAKVYYSNTAGTIRWGNYAYGTWPDPIATPGGGSANYCIYATGTAPTLTSIVVTPANPSIATGGTQQFTATGNYSDGSTQNLTSQVAWTSSVPAVATINASGLATGVSAGTSTISATLAGVSGNATLTVQPPPLTITTTSLPNGTVNTAYAATLAASGGTGPYFWAITNGSLPAGLTLNTNTGAISGTPTASGTSNFTARVRDSSNPIQTITRALGITVTTTLISIAVTPTTPTITTGGTQQFTATGTYSDSSTQNIAGQVAWTSSVPVVATISAGGLATGVSAGTSTISATLSGVSGNTTLTVQPPPLTITTTALPNGTMNTAYTATFAASGGTGPYYWGIANGSLPVGLTLNTNNGTISGTPTAAGTSNFTAQVRDSGNPIQSTNKAFSIAIASAPTTVGNTDDGTLIDDIGASWINAGRFQAPANLTAITMYAKVAAITGKYRCAIYSDVAGQPSRLLRSSAEVTNPAVGWQAFALTSPLTLTNGQFYWLAIWSDNNKAAVYYSSTAGTIRWDRFSYGTWPDPIATSGGANVNYCIYASGTAATLTSIAVTPANPSIAMAGTQQFTATGTYSDSSNQNLTSLVAWTSSIPAVATINASGLASGVTVGSTTISATVGGVSGNTTLTVQPPPVTITTTTLPNGTMGAAYAATLAASGGTAPYTWSLTNGLLPAGLTLNTNTGAISGTPTAVGTSNFTARVRDLSNPIQTATKALSITVTTTLISIAVTPANPSIAVGGTQQFTATGTYSDSSTQNLTSQVVWTSSIPAVVTISASGLATGVTVGNTTISATLGGVGGNTTLTVQPPPVTITTTTLPNGTVGVAYAATLAASGGTAPYTWLLTNGLLPAGLTLNTNSGAITGTPTAAGASNFTARVRDSGSPVQSTNKALSITVSIQPSGNPIVIENAKPGNPTNEWNVAGDGNATIQGFATAISVNNGEVVQFKVKTTASNYRLDVYRLGYYGGLGARFIATVTPSVSLPQTQPNPITDAATGLVDCGNWAVSASWQVPTNATSGIYIAKLVRPDTGGASHIFFIVRDDTGGSDLLFQTSDTAWQAYNTYGGNSLYTGAPVGRAYKVSYNRPIATRASVPFTSPFSAEYPMVRWLEANGYNVSYTTGVDTDRRGNLLLQHRAYLSVGHDEYWSGVQRTNVEAARNSGVHLAFFSGNEIFWKTRWEPSIDGSATPHRTLVCYKETHANAKIDPTAAWTGTWRDPRFSPPADGGRPENALSGTIFMVNGITLNSLAVPAVYGKHRFWRNTSVASLTSGQVAVFGAGILGFEWDHTPDNGFQPPGQMKLSLTTTNGVQVLQDYGSTYATGQATHSLSLYRHSSGALVFGAGTVQWSWGLDNVHDDGAAIADVRMRQATVNLFADMGIQPGTLQSGLVPAVQSTDITAPNSSISNPIAGATVQSGSPVTVTGTATDSGGLIWGTEVSTDGGTIWHPAVGQGSWSYAWTPAGSGSVAIKSRAVDDSGNLETPAPGVTVTVAAGQTIGNTSDGTLTDVMGASWINAGRFQATANMTVTTMLAKVAAITGRYKCAIYSENAGQPSRLLRASTELVNPGAGWQSFPLTSSLALTNGQYYWLAIWSDNGNSQVYYTSGGGTLRWAFYNYGTWPDPIATGGGANVNYCIYATTGAGATMASMAVAPPTQPTILSVSMTNGVVAITCSAAEGQNYVLEYVNNLEDTNWLQVLPPVQATGPTVTITNSAGEASRRFYRVVNLMN